MIILATSDLHGNLPIINDEFDLFLIVGDICPDFYGFYTKQIEWINDELIPWVNKLKFKYIWSKIILVPGNHDECFNGHISKLQLEEWRFKTSNHLVILNHEYYEYDYLRSDLEIDSLKIFGTPYCKKFGNWAFMVDNDILIKKYSQIPENIDILLSHDSPTIEKLGAVLDEESRFYNPTAGNEILSEFIWKIKPKIFHSGHMHTGNHNFFEKNGIWFANVSYVDESLSPSYPILKYEFDEYKKIVNYV